MTNTPERSQVIAEMEQVEKRLGKGELVPHVRLVRLFDAALALLRKAEEEVTEAREAFKEMHEAACVESGKAEEAEAKLTEAHAEIERLREALEELRINANRLCDRNLGGTYEEDCRRSIAGADAALSTPEAR